MGDGTKSRLYTVYRNRKAGDNVRGKERFPRITEEVLCAEYEAIYRYVLSLCRNDAEAQDITQDAFLKAMKASGATAISGANMSRAMWQRIFTRRQSGFAVR